MGWVTVIIQALLAVIKGIWGTDKPVKKEVIHAPPEVDVKKFHDELDRDLEWLLDGRPEGEGRGSDPAPGRTVHGNRKQED